MQQTLLFVSEDNDANFDGMDLMVLDALVSLPHGPDTDPSVAGDDIALMLGVNMPSEVKDSMSSSMHLEMRTLI